MLTALFLTVENMPDFLDLDLAGPYWLYEDTIAYSRVKTAMRNSVFSMAVNGPGIRDWNYQ